MLRTLPYLCVLIALTDATGKSNTRSSVNICTVTGPTVIDFNGDINSVTDRCAYSLLSDSSSDLKLFANFRERRRRDVSFLESVSLRLDDLEIYLHMKHSGEAWMNGRLLTLNRSVQQFNGVKLSKDKTGITATFLVTNFTTSLFFDGSSAQIYIEAPVESSWDGLCVDSSCISRANLPRHSSRSCDTQYKDPVDSSINCTTVTERCNILMEEPFSSCNADIDPTPYINACSDTLCKYPSVDGLRCQFLWAYARACDLTSDDSIESMESSEDECSSPEAFCQDKTCSNDEFCGETFTGEHACLCRALFAYKYKLSESLGDPPVCRQNSGSITLVGCLLEEKGIDYSVLHLNNQSCKGVMDEESHMVTFSFDTSNTCGTEITNNGSQTIYKNTIKSQNSSDFITRQSSVNIDFSCYERQPKTAIMGFKIKDSSVVQKITSGEFSYSVMMKAYTNAARTHPVTSNTEVLLNQKIWLELDVDGLDEDMVAVVTDSCWATSQESPSSKQKYYLIKKGCADDPTVQVEENGEGTSNYFSFNMFQFSGSSGEVYLHCKLQLCSKKGNDCEPDCSGGDKRRRRSVGLINRYGAPALISMAWTN